MKSLFYALIAGGGVLLLLASVSFLSIIRPIRFTSSLTPQRLGMPYTTLTLTTQDGLKLHAWFIPGKQVKNNKTVILLHGYPADKGNVLPAMRFLHEHYNLLLFDFRYLGKSEGRYTTLGAKEMLDLFAAIQYLKSRDIHDIAVWGFSMGGAVALMAAEKSPDIKVMITDSSYARLDLMSAVYYRVPGLRTILGGITHALARLVFGVHPREVSPVAAARALQIPVLIIHSRDDSMIPFSHALMLKAALKDNPRAEFYFRDHLGHGQLGSDYQARVGAFLAKYF